ncbi:ATP-binding cassette sub-family A member 3 like protein [Argiope bruennichi]|uniref:ATP-binding cassette sub-family A member 3 like protein n=1 Tax=Argiope bruennichi TaxID=94029 RepID=A0A8T0E8Y1_ARGBR|nr:ATP-binding cassette sub-family A member 3 like protein [Argiope bruennichi]
MPNTNGLRQFSILLYKGLLLRKRHYFVTFFEIIVPIIIAAIPCMIQQEPYNPPSGKNVGRQFRSDWVNYTTFRPFDPFKSHAGTWQYNLERSEQRNGVRRLLRLQAKDFFNGIGTVFKEFDNKLPASLDYTIRYGTSRYSNFHTDMKYQVNGPHYNNAYEDSLFLAWQASVEQTFINRKMAEQGEDAELRKYQVWMQQFPYPEHKDTKNSFSVVNIVPWVICYGYLIFIMNIMRRVIEEKSNGSKELLKMMGMTDFTYWASTFMNYFIYAFVIMLIVTILYKVPMKTSTAFLQHMNFFLLFIVLLLFIASLILFCMALSIFSNRANFATVALIIIYIPSCTLLMTKFFMTDSEVSYYPLSVASKLGICLLPQGALLTAFYIISSYEASGDGIGWNNINEFSLIPDINMAMILVTMLISCGIYIIFIWYFDAVWPWQPGVPKPFYFFLTRSYWCGARQVQDTEENKLVKNEYSSDFFEEEPSNISRGVIIRNLAKEFRSGLTTKLAVNDVSLNIYEGQITALLGHNGAGKTTTINILTGLYTPTSGTALISGLDILTETTRARRGLGVCPQHNVLYDTLTVEEHLKIYAAMKGVLWKDLNSEVTEILDIMKLADKKSELTKNLSGGMKRKLSLGIALIGGSKVLFLDEPTSGLDVEARRNVWDALLEMRHKRTIILTTHYMEEADILGDRIAIMAEGELQCCGSPMFLKQKFGTGYHLHVVKDQDFDLQALTLLIQKYIPEASLRSELEKEISFSLSTNTGNEFGDMFEELENRKKELGVLSFGITITTMEDVFLKVSNISDMKYNARSEEDKQSDEIQDIYGDSPGMRPHRHPINQFLALIKKRFNYSKRFWSILIVQVVLPLFLTTICLYLIKNNSFQFKTTFKPLKLDISSVYGETDGFYYSDKPPLSDLSDTVKNVFKSNRITVQKVPEPTHYVLDYGKKDISKYLKNLIVGAAVDQYSNGTLNLTAWFNGEPYHAISMSLLLAHTALLKNVTNTGSITLTNAPLPVLKVMYSNGQGFMARILAGIFIPLAFAYLSASFVLLPVHERMTKAKLLQLMNGISGTMYWGAMFLWDYVVFFIISMLFIIPYAIFANTEFFGKHSESIGAAIVLMLLYGWAAIPLSYIISFLFQKGNTAFSTVVALCSIIGVGCSSILNSILLTIPFAEVTKRRINEAIWALRIVPAFSLSSGISNLFGVAFDNAFCETVPPDALELNCNSSTIDRNNPIFKCCKSKCGDECLHQVNPFGWTDKPFGGKVHGLSGGCSSSLKTVDNLVTQESIIEDSDVLEEEERTLNVIEAHSVYGEEALLVSELTKVYKNFYAVNHLTFGIHQEECFGLLGVNGAGKTSTFRMLTGDCHPTEGNAFIQNVSVRKNLKKFQSYLGYCPQFDALIDRLTGREMLMLFGQLRGLTSTELEERINKLIKMTDLTKHADKQTRFYSGGNKRKLSVAIALIGSPPLILLDEPTAGVDPVSRRKIWGILAQARNNTGAAILLTTHSMEESEALCNRLAIMVNGRFRCLGSIQQLKTKYGQGYTLIIKMKREDQENIESITTIKTHVESNLHGANLKDDHQGNASGTPLVNPPLR